ncbi:hypothetical protein EVAR_102811_1 [Eumeta japonica]|uniref:Nucleic-acid-binding protein from transposon X-element n=1 Tax=Eumeta variegata TaxID=151549 RepID=A0A4C1TJ83_EUMVA|nr:hypothetical protein EVAR_102811_1 [Eumeta japonica]
MIQQTYTRACLQKHAATHSVPYRKISTSLKFLSANDPTRIPGSRTEFPSQRKRVETKSPQTENIKKKSNTSTYAIPIHNQFDILDDEEATTDNNKTEKPPKPEPIFVTGVLDINALRNKLKEITTTDDYTMTTLKSGHIVKIMPANIEIYKSIRD